MMLKEVDRFVKVKFSGICLPKTGQTEAVASVARLSFYQFSTTLQKQRRLARQRFSENIKNYFVNLFCEMKVEKRINNTIPKMVLFLIY